MLFALASLPAFLFVAHYIQAIIAMGAIGPWSASGVSTDTTQGIVLQLTVAGTLAIGLVVGLIFGAYKYTDRAVLRISGARTIQRREQPALFRIVENLSIGAGLPAPRLAVVDSSAINAMSTGRRPESSTLVVTKGLLMALDRRETEGVVAQELSQIGNLDVRLETMVAAFVMVMWLPYLLIRGVYRAALSVSSAASCCVGACLLYVAFMVGSALVMSITLSMTMLKEDRVVGAVFLLATLLPLYAFAIGPLIGVRIKRVLSSEREYLADADAALLTRYPPGLAKALAKMSVEKASRVETNPALSHLWIVDPEGPGEGVPLRGGSHPPIEERIDLLKRMGGTTSEMLAQARRESSEYLRSIAAVSK